MKKYSILLITLLTAGIFTSCEKSAVEPAACGNNDHATAYVIEDDNANTEVRRGVREEVSIRRDVHTRGTDERARELHRQGERRAGEREEHRVRPQAHTRRGNLRDPQRTRPGSRGN